MHSSTLIKISLDLRSQHLTDGTYVLRHSSGSQQTQASWKKREYYVSLHGHFMAPRNFCEIQWILLVVPGLLPEEGLLGSHTGVGPCILGVLNPSDLEGLHFGLLDPWHNLSFPVDFISLLRNLKVSHAKYKVGFLLECGRGALDSFVFYQGCN